MDTEDQDSNPFIDIALILSIAKSQRGRVDNDQLVGDLATHIEKKPVYTFDSFGRYVHAENKSNILCALADHYRLQHQEPHLAEDPDKHIHGGTELPLGCHGWALNDLPAKFRMIYGLIFPEAVATESAHKGQLRRLVNSHTLLSIKWPVFNEKFILTEKYLSSPPKWLDGAYEKAALMSKTGRPTNGWNPARFAFALLRNNKSNIRSLHQCMKKDWEEWFSEWEDICVDNGRELPGED